MKKFFFKILLFFIPFFVWIVIELSIPPSKFTHRNWEALIYKSEVPRFGSFYQNTTSFMIAEGDLCFNTENSVKKNELWITDQIGFRNDSFIEQADVLIIGDSFIAGTSLNQDDILSNQLKKLQPQLLIYNMAPSSMKEFDKFYKMGIIKKPKMIIFSNVERDIPPRFSIKNYQLKGKIIKTVTSFLNNSKLNIYTDKLYKRSSVRWLNAKIMNPGKTSFEGIKGSNMFFLEGTSQFHEKEDLLMAVDNISAYKKYCDSLGIRFLYLPMPDKESVYFDYVPLANQDNYLFQMDSLLKENKVNTVNTLKIYNEYRKTNDSLLYHLDDTHWNAKATNLIAKEINLILEHNKFN